MSVKYLGYGELEELLRDHDPGQPVFLLSLDTPGQGDRKYGIALNEVSLEVESVSGDQVRYCHLRIGQYQALHSDPLDPEHQARVAARGEQVKRLVCEYLEEHGFTWRPCITAKPKSLRYLNGWANFLAWNEAKKEFYRTDRVGNA